MRSPSPVLPGAARRSAWSASGVTCARSRPRLAANPPVARISGTPPGASPSGSSSSTPPGEPLRAWPPAASTSARVRPSGSKRTPVVSGFPVSRAVTETPSDSSQSMSPSKRSNSRRWRRSSPSGHSSRKLPNSRCRQMTPLDSSIEPPGRSSFSRTSGCAPRLRASAAATRPAIPAPATTRSAMASLPATERQRAQTSAKPGLCSTYSIRTPSGPRRKTANVFFASFTSSISNPAPSASSCTPYASSTSSARWFSSGRSPTRSTTRSSAPRCRGPSASNSVSLPSLASMPTSVNVSVSSITCMPRCSQANVARSSRSSTQRATWSRLVGAKFAGMRRELPLRGASNLGKLVLGQLDLGSAHVLLQMRDRRGARNRQHHRRAREQPGQRDPGRRGVVLAGDPVERPTAPCQVSGGEREPRDETDAELLAALEDVVRAAVLEVVAVLHRHDCDDRARPLELVDRHVRDPDVPDFALVLQLLHRSNGVLQRHLRVGRMQLVDVDPLQPEPAQAALARLLQVLRAAVARPLPRPGAQETALRGDHQPVGIRVERLGDQVLTHLGPVRVGRVDQVDAELNDAPKDPFRLVRILGRAPDAPSRDPHSAEAETVDLEVPADREGVHPADARG